MPILSLARLFDDLTACVMESLIPAEYYSYFEYLPDIQKCVNAVMIIAPVISYGTTCWQLYRRKTSHGFSLDICATMLMAALLRIYYYHVSPFEITLLYQLMVMVGIQSVLLAVALRYRPGHYDPELLPTLPPLITEIREKSPEQKPGILLLTVLSVAFVRSIKFFDVYYKRPFCFWQWKSPRIYWRFMLGFLLLFAQTTLFFSGLQWYANFIGSMGLFIEALLPLPQILLLARLQSIENFNVILLLLWLSGDVTKIGYLIYGTSNISAIFLAAGLFQMSLDVFIAFQYLTLRFGNTPETEDLEMKRVPPVDL